mgnify:CR=1 FL=1
MKNELIKRIGIFVCLLIAVNCLSAGNFPVEMRINPSTGAISELTLEGDNRSMNWVVKTDGTQYPWVKDNYGWGLGYFTAVKGKETVKREWRVPVEISPDGMKVLYREGDIRILVKREIKQGDLPMKEKNQCLYMMWLSILLSMIIIRMHNNALIPVLIRIFGKVEVLPMSMLSVWELLLPIWDWW